MNDDITAAMPESAPKCVTVRLVVGAIALAIRLVTPEFVSARPKMSTVATVIVAGWLKPENALAGATTPTTTATRRAAKATTS